MSNELPADVAVWNEFSQRPMTLVFLDSTTGSHTEVRAIVGGVIQVSPFGVPEPAMSFMCIAGTLFLLASRFTRYQNEDVLGRAGKRAGKRGHSTFLDMREVLPLSWEHATNSAG